MKELDKKIKGRGEVKGYEFNQIKATKLGFIYSKECKETNKISFEVFKRVENTQFNCVSYPTSKSFGIWAWECSSFNKANEILNKFKLKELK